MTRLARFAWGGLAFTVAVVLWGAFVRATGSGAGCGEHWPLCNGEVLPRAPAVQTLIELTHRATSGLAFLFTVVLWVWTFRVHPRGSPVRKAAVASFILMVMEALIGAGLVLFRLVAENASMARAYAMSAHLVNTFLLLGALTLTADLASGRPAPRVRGQGAVGGAFLAAFLGMMLLGVSGAVTALGDTLFPATGFTEGMSPTAHVLLRLRLFHPLLAVVAGLLVVGAAWFAQAQRPSPDQRKQAQLLTGLFALQLGVGVLNVLLLAPVWMQLVHLFLADAVWIVLVRTATTAFAAPVTHAAAAPDAALEPLSR